MADATELQIDFSGGANSRLDSELIGDNQYVTAENIEIREGPARSRAGSFTYLGDVPGETVQGAGVYHGITPDKPDEIFIVAQDDKIKVLALPCDRIELTKPTNESVGEYVFQQALEDIYIFRGEGMEVWKWSGDTDDPIVTLTPPSAPNLIMFGSDRVLYEYNRWWIVTDEDTLNISDPLTERFQPNFNLKVNQGKDGERIVAIHPFAGGSLLVFKERSLALIQNANSLTAVSDLTQEYLDDFFGIVSSRAALAVGKDVWFLSPLGVMSVVLNEQQKSQLIRQPISSVIPDDFQRINMRAADGVDSVRFDNKVIWAVPIDNSRFNNAMLVYDLVSKSFIPFWTGHSVARFVVVREDSEDRLFYFDYEGGFHELNVGLYKDFENANHFQLEFFDSSSTQTLDISSVLTGLDPIGGLTTGVISIRLRLRAITDGNILFASNASNTDYLRIYLSGGSIFAQLVEGGVIQWEIERPNIRVGLWQSVTLNQDGTSPKLFLSRSGDGQKNNVTLDVTKWLDDLTEDDLRLGSNDTQSGTPVLPADAFDGEIKHIFFTGDTGLDDVLARFDLNEGTGTTVTDLINTKTGTFGAGAKAPDWSTAVSTPTDIATKLLTRSYSFNSLQVAKALSRCEMIISHRNPNLSLKMFTNLPEVMHQIILNRTYNPLKWLIHGQADFNPLNPLNRQNDPYREDYAPVTLPAPPGIHMDIDGFVIDQEQQHNEFFHEVETAASFQFELTNSQGTVSLQSLALTANRQGFAGKESMADGSS